jgi:hypothetical protein
MNGGVVYNIGKEHGQNWGPTVTLASLLRRASLTNSNSRCHDNLPPLCCLHISIHTFIQSRLFAMYKCSASHPRTTESKKHNSPILNISYNVQYEGNYKYL